VTVRDYRSKLSFSLVGGSDEERVSFYSKKRDDASTKIQTPEIMEELVSFFRKQGLEKRASSGTAPVTTSTATKCIEVRDGDGVRHLLRTPQMPADVANAFEQYVQAFLIVYQETYALQSVEDSNGPQGPTASEAVRD
jgi:hypothetical protein